MKNRTLIDKISNYERNSLSTFNKKQTSRSKQDRQRNIMSIHVTTVAMGMQQCIVCNAELHITISNMTLKMCCHGNATMGSLCIVVKLQNILYCCQNYKNT